MTVPSFAALDCTGAQSALEAVHLHGACPAPLEAYSPTVPSGQVITWRQNGIAGPATVKYGSTVNLVISKGPPPVPIPAVSGTFAQAEATLVAAGFTVSETRGFSSTVPVGQVIGTNPPAGTQVQKGSNVQVIVSQGPPLQTVPNLVGKTVAAATAKLSALGLKVGAVYGPPGGHVFETSPGAGASVKIGSIVNLYVR